MQRKTDETEIHERGKLFNRHYSEILYNRIQDSMFIYKEDQILSYAKNS